MNLTFSVINHKSVDSVPLTSVPNTPSVFLKISQTGACCIKSCATAKIYHCKQHNIPNLSVLRIIN